MRHRTRLVTHAGIRDDQTMRRRPRTDPVVRAAVVGAGRMGRWHVRAIEAAGGTVAAVVDPDVSRARALANGAAAVPSLADLGSRPGLDVAHICTPLEAHVDAVRAALDCGAHAIVEKPLAESAEATSLLLEHAAGRGLAVVPVHQFLFQPGVQQILRRREELGSLVRCVFLAASAGAEVTGIDADTLVAEILPHPLSLFARLTQVDVGALDWHVIRPAPGELRAVSVADTTSLEIAVTARGRPIFTGLEAMGTEATAHADFFQGFATIDRGRATRARKLSGPFVRSTKTLVGAGVNLAARTVAWETGYPGLRVLVQRTYAAIASGSAPPISPAETIAVATARDRILDRIRVGA